jgi:hydrogenase expression/formation protein HypD
MMRVPGSSGSLLGLKAEGADVRVVYSCLDAVSIAEENHEKKVVFMGVGFETTAPTVAAAVIEAKKRGVRNFFVMPCFKTVFPALYAIASSKDIAIDGFICPGHVSVITGSAPYQSFVKRFKKPCVIMGFEETDLLTGLKRLISFVREKKPVVHVEYKRAVTPAGNKRAMDVLYRVFEPCDAKWRGLGLIKKSGLKFRSAYRRFDALSEFKVKVPGGSKRTGCICGDVLKGVKSPADCKLFRKICNPERPVGPCMVSTEGTCAAYYKYGC